MHQIRKISKRARSLPKRFVEQTFCLIKGKNNADDEERSLKTIKHPSKYEESKYVCIGDPKIFENILSFLDVPTLRELRFVNKSWNEAVCRFLRKTIIITMLIGSVTNSRTRNFGKFLFTTMKTSNLLPFRFLRLNISDWEDETLDQILNDDRILPREICVKQDTSSVGYEARLSKILTSKCSQIQKLGLNVGLPSFRFENTYLPALHVLFMIDPNNSEIYSDFVIRLINVAPNIEILWIFGQDPNFVCRILENSGPHNIHELGDLCMQSIFSETMWLNNFPNLKKLTAIEYAEQSPFKNVPLTLVKAFAKVVEELQILWDPTQPSSSSTMSEMNFPHCPKLRLLFIRNWGGSVGGFSSTQLPQLKELIFFDEIIGSDDDQITQPHFGVESFVMESYRREPERLFASEKFTQFLLHVAKQFPSLTSLELFWRIKYEYIQLIVENFPKLQKLLLYAVQGYSDEIIFTGINEDDLRICLIEGVDLKRVARKPCLIDLKELQQLTLLEGYVHFPTLNKKGILYGISKIPKLEQLTIHFDSRLIDQDIKKSLAKLKTFTILTSEQIWEYKVGRQEQRLCSFMKKLR